MFDFQNLSEVVTDPKDFMVPQAPSSEANKENPDGPRTGSKGSRKFVEITKDTPLSSLNRFFEWNSAAVVTERDRDDPKTMKPIAVVTKVDLLTWVVRNKKQVSTS